MKLSNVKILSRIISYSVSKFLILKCFHRHKKVISFMVTIFIAWCQKLGVQSQKLGCNCTPAPM